MDFFLKRTPHSFDAFKDRFLNFLHPLNFIGFEHLAHLQAKMLRTSLAFFFKAIDQRRRVGMALLWKDSHSLAIKLVGFTAVDGASIRGAAKAPGLVSVTARTYVERGVSGLKVEMAAAA